MLSFWYLIFTTVITLVIDLFWLGFVANKFYLQELHKLLRLSSDGKMAPLWTPAVLVYFVIPVAIFAFSLPRAMGKPVPEAFLIGALLGFCMYAVYDLTNLATLSGWSLKVTIVDMIWGAVLCGSVTALVTHLGPLILGK